MNPSPVHVTAAESHRPPTAIAGIPFDPLTTQEAVLAIADMVATRQPHYVLFADTDFVAQAFEDVELRRLLLEADAVLGNSVPLLWLSRMLGDPLPQRIEATDFTLQLLAEAETRGWRVACIGQDAETLAQAMDRALAHHPRLQVAGSETLPEVPLTDMDHAAIWARLLELAPDLLLVDLESPLQEKWIGMHYLHSRIPVTIGVGHGLGSLALGRVAIRARRSANRRTRRCAMTESGPVVPRGFHDAFVVFPALVSQTFELHPRRPSFSAGPGPTWTEPAPPGESSQAPARTLLPAPERLDAEAAIALAPTWRAALQEGDVVLDLAATSFIDSSGVGFLVRLRKQALQNQRQLILTHVQPPILRAFMLMKIERFFDFAASPANAVAQQQQRSPDPQPLVQPARLGPQIVRLDWHGEVTAVTVAALAKPSEAAVDEMSANSTVVVDLQDVPFIDSSGLSLMIRLKKRARRQGSDLSFVNPCPSVQNVVRTSRLEGLLLLNAA